MSRARIHRLDASGWRSVNDPPECAHVAYCGQIGVTARLCPETTTWDWGKVTCKRCLSKRGRRPRSPAPGEHERAILRNILAMVEDFPAAYAPELIPQAGMFPDGLEELRDRVAVGEDLGDVCRDLLKRRGEGGAHGS